MFMCVMCVSCNDWITLGNSLVAFYKIQFTLLLENYDCFSLAC